MTLNELIFCAASVYPDQTILEYWDSERECPVPEAEAGDTLASFIACELADTFNPDASDTIQLVTAIKVLQQASQELDGVVRAIQGLAVERLKLAA